MGRTAAPPIRATQETARNIIRHPHQHPEYRALRDRRGELMRRLTDLEEGGDTIERRLHEVEAQVEALYTKQLIDGVEPAELSAFQEHKQRLQTERAELMNEEPRLAAAIAEIERRMNETESRISAELRPAILAEHRALAETLYRQLKVASPTNTKLRELCQEAGGWMQFPVYHWFDLELMESMRADDYSKSPQGSSRLSRMYREMKEAGYEV